MTFFKGTLIAIYPPRFLKKHATREMLLHSGTERKAFLGDQQSCPGGYNTRTDAHNPEDRVAAIRGVPHPAGRNLRQRRQGVRNRENSGENDRRLAARERRVEALEGHRHFHRFRRLDRRDPADPRRSDREDPDHEGVPLREDF